jgi:hypothetical protein
MPLVNPSISSPIKTIQRGYANNATSITVAAVNTAKSVVRTTSRNGAFDGSNTIINPGFRLSNSTTLAVVGPSGVDYSWELIEYV